MSNDSAFPVPGTVLWAVDVDLERDVFRSGAATKPNVEYLRFVDLGISGREGRIPADEGDKHVHLPASENAIALEVRNEKH